MLRAEALPPPSKKPKRKKARQADGESHIEEGKAGGIIELVEVVNPLAASQAKGARSNDEASGQKAGVPAIAFTIQQSTSSADVASAKCSVDVPWTRRYSRKGAALGAHALSVSLFTLLLTGVASVTTGNAFTNGALLSWLNVPYAQMACYVAVIGSCAFFTITLSLPHPHLQKGKSMVAFVTVSFIFALFCDAQRAVENRWLVRSIHLGSIDVDRGNCSRLEDLFPDNGIFIEVCPGLSAVQAFATVHPALEKISRAEYHGHSDDSRILVGEKLGRMKDLIGMYTRLHLGGDDTQIQCGDLLSAYLCNLTLPLCQFSDCSPLTDTKCLDLRQSTEDRATMKVCNQTYTNLLDKLERDVANNGYAQYLDNAERQYVGFLREVYSEFTSFQAETSVPGLSNNMDCKGDDISSSHIDPASRNATAKSKDAGLTCDPQVTKFESSTSLDYEYNMAAFWVFVIAVFFMIVLAFGNIDRVSFDDVDGVRVAVTFLGIFMGVLVFAGALQLQNASKSAAQTSWACLYFVVSWLCLQGGMFALTMKKGTDLVLKRQEKQKDITFIECSLAGYSCFCLNSPLSIKWFNRVRRAYSEIEPGGRYFPVKLVLLEFTEIIIQLSSLLDSTPSSDAEHVLVSAIAISANLLVLSIITMLSQRMFASQTAALSAILVVEVLFDKIFVSIIVFLRPDTITEDGLELSSQMSRHLGLLFPALLTALDMKDALDLKDYEESNQHDRNWDGKPFTRLEGNHYKCLHANCCGHLKNCRLQEALARFIQVSMALFGLFLGLHTSIAFSQQRESCKDVLGGIAMCAFPRLYFRDGLFQSTTCGWENVTSLNCTSRLSKAERSRMVRLPDAELQYSSMSLLQNIDVSHSKKLQNMPLGWAHVPRQNPNESHLIIRAEDCPRLSEVPPPLCSRVSSLGSLVLGMRTAASKSLDWNGRLTYDGLSLNSACEMVWRTSLRFLHLADNNLTCDMGEKQKDRGGSRRYDLYWDTTKCNFDDIYKLKGLTYVNLRNNRIKRITVHLTAKLSRVLRMNSSGGVSIEGNPVESLELPLQPRLQVVSWLHNLKVANEHLRRIQIRGSTIGVNGSKILADVLNGSHVSVLIAGQCMIGDNGMASLVPALRTLERSLETVHFGSNFMTAKGLTLLLEGCLSRSNAWNRILLNLNGNNFVNVDGKLLAQLLVSNQNIEELRIADCDLPGPVCTVVLESVPMAKKLKTLSLNNDCKTNQIAMFDLLVNVLPKSNLSHLNVAATGFYMNAKDQQILASLLNMTHLTRLDIDMDDEYAKESGLFKSSKNINGDSILVKGGRL